MEMAQRFGQNLQLPATSNAIWIAAKRPFGFAADGQYTPNRACMKRCVRDGGRACFVSAGLHFTPFGARWNDCNNLT
jgi:hypothetical protein